MHRLWDRGRRVRQTAWPRIWPAAVLLCAWLPSAVQAECIVNPDPEMRHIQRLISKDATRALKQIEDRMEAVRRQAVTTAGRTGQLASLYAVEAEAYGILERSAEARNSAAEGLKLATLPNDPVRLQLLSAYAENVYDEAGIAAAASDIETARSAQKSDTQAAVCLLITRGLLEHRQNRADLAIVTLTQAYHASAAPSMTEPHVLSAEVLSAVMRVMGDYEQALALNQEVIDWHTSRGETLSLSVARFMRGQILKLLHHYPEAIVEYTQARKLSVILDDAQGIAYADLRICEAHIELGELTTAQGECAGAVRLFAAAESADSVKAAQALLARIDLKLGRAESALETLNAVLDHDGTDLPPIDVTALYESRAQANAALHNYRNAYYDLREYALRFAASNDAERGRQAGALRARFETDRQIERNSSLQRELAVSQELSRRQMRQLRWNAVIAVTGVGVIALLIYFLITNVRYRQRLLTLAGQDGLTGLPNRRRIAEFAATALETARTTGRPLTIALIDMDQFKIINDCCGHATGDYVLKEFARAGGEALRAGDLLGRWGGEEFLLVSPGSTLSVGMATLERLRTLIYRIRLPASGVGLRVSLSAGVAAFDASVNSLDELIARADKALYAAKSAGRDRVSIADATQITGAHGARRTQRI
jgi:diguanylate cyclase (GGDEF)-like protein